MTKEEIYDKLVIPKVLWKIYLDDGKVVIGFFKSVRGIRIKFFIPVEDSTGSKIKIEEFSVATSAICNMEHFWLQPHDKLRYSKEVFLAKKLYLATQHENFEEVLMIKLHDYTQKKVVSHFVEHIQDWTLID